MTVADHLPTSGSARRDARRIPRQVAGRPIAAGVIALLIGSSTLLFGGCAAAPSVGSSTGPLPRDDPGIGATHVAAAWLPEAAVGSTFGGDPTDWHWSTPPTLRREMGSPTPCRLESASAEGTPTAWLGSLQSGPVITDFEPGAWTDHLDRDRRGLPAFAGLDSPAGGTPVAPDSTSILTFPGQQISGSIMSFAAGLFMLVVVSIPAGLAIASSCFGRASRAPPSPI